MQQSVLTVSAKDPDDGKIVVSHCQTNCLHLLLQLLKCILTFSAKDPNSGKLTVKIKVRFIMICIPHLRILLYIIGALHK